MPPIGLLVFIAILALAVYSVRGAVRKTTARRALVAQHPNEPWMWRSDWAERAVRSAEPLPAAALWAFGVLWLLISLPPFFLARPLEGPARYLLFLFPAVGVLVLLFALRQTFKRRKYGVSLCRIERLPIPLGSTFRGEIQTHVRELPERGFQLRLTCIRRIVTGSGKNRSTRENVLWQEEQNAGSGQAMPSPDGMRVPFRFDLPNDCEPCDDTNPRDTVLWRLEIAADVPGIDYSTAFELPVFRAADAPAHDSFAPAAAMPWTPSESIQFGMSPSGGEEIVVRARSSAADWIFYLVFVVLWYGALWFMYTFGVPSWAVIFFAAFGTVVLIAALDTLAGSTRIAADRNALTVRRALFVMRRARTYPVPELESIEPRIGRSSGGRAYYEVVAHRKNGRAVKLAKNIRDKRDAEGIAARVKRQLGM